MSMTLDEMTQGVGVVHQQDYDSLLRRIVSEQQSVTGAANRREAIVQSHSEFLEITSEGSDKTSGDNKVCDEPVGF